ncbi:unnamed protein product, partial [Closterium sp. Yama58-4]
PQSSVPAGFQPTAPHHGLGGVTAPSVARALPEHVAASRLSPCRGDQVHAPSFKPLKRARKMPQ